MHGENGDKANGASSMGSSLGRRCVGWVGAQSVASVQSVDPLLIFNGSYPRSSLLSPSKAFETGMKGMKGKTAKRQRAPWVYSFVPFVPFVLFVVKKSVFHLRRFYSAAAWVSRVQRASTCLRSVVSAPMLTLSICVPLRTDGVR